MLDIKAETEDGTMLDIEMQMEDEKDIDERATSYMGKLISEQLQVGNKYTELKKSIVIFITNYNFLKRNSYHSVGRLKFEKTLKEEYVELGYKEENEIASEYIEYHYIELPKYKNKNTKVKHICPCCKTNLINLKSTICESCYNKERAEKIYNIISRDNLKVLIRSTPFIRIGNMYKVTDNTIRKWCDKYNLPRKVSEIQKYTDEEWINI